MNHDMQVDLAAAALARAVNTDKDQFPRRSAIRWRTQGRYDWAAIKAGDGHWYTTGTVGKTKLTYGELTTILASSAVSDIEVATGWQKIGGDETCRLAADPDLLEIELPPEVTDLSVSQLINMEVKVREYGYGMAGDLISAVISGVRSLPGYPGPQFEICDYVAPRPVQVAIDPSQIGTSIAKLEAAQSMACVLRRQGRALVAVLVEAYADAVQGLTGESEEDGLRRLGEEGAKGF